ncbi:MAG: hypothetical protein JWP36_1712 [Paucimonas sp.]|nr:hypothetical protein [Paucimonas sp.]
MDRTLKTAPRNDSAARLQKEEPAKSPKTEAKLAPSLPGELREVEKKNVRSSPSGKPGLRAALAQAKPNWETAFEGKSQDDHFTDVRQQVVANAVQQWMDRQAGAGMVKVLGVEFDESTGQLSHIAIVRKGKNDGASKLLAVPVSASEVRNDWAGGRMKAAWAGTPNGAVDAYNGLMADVAAKTKEVNGLYRPRVGVDTPGSHARRAFDALELASKLIAEHPANVEPSRAAVLNYNSETLCLPDEQQALRFLNAYHKGTLDTLVAEMAPGDRLACLPALLLCAFDSMGIFMTDKAGSQERWEALVAPNTSRAAAAASLTGDGDERAAKAMQVYPAYAREAVSRFVNHLKDLQAAAKGKSKAAINVMDAATAPPAALRIMGVQMNRLIFESLVRDGKGVTPDRFANRLAASGGVSTSLAMRLFDSTEDYLG